MSAIRKLITTGLLVAATPSFASQDAGWYLQPVLGFSGLSDTSGERIDGGRQTVDVAVDSGFVSGLMVGYRYSANLSTQIGWEYRSNDSFTNYADGSRFPEGNYASNFIYLNGVWHFDARGRWQPYVGGGVGFVQEIDIDLESGGVEQSFSGSGDVGFQLFGGVEYLVSERWRVGAELRYTNIGSIDLPAEENATGSIDGLDYDPITVGLTLTYLF